MTLSTLEILEAWELLSPEQNLSKYSMKDWKAVARAFEEASTTRPKPAVGSVHLGLSHGTALVERSVDATALAIPLLTSEKVWLPDPFISFFSESANRAWELMPDANSDFFGAGGAPISHWKGLWQVPPDRRKNRIREVLPPLLDRLRELKPLLDSGAISFLPWEPTVLTQKANLQELTRALTNQTAAPSRERLSAKKTAHKFRSVNFWPQSAPWQGGWNP